MKAIFFSALAVFGTLTNVALADPVRLGGSAFAQNCGTSTTIVSAASNVAGILITTGSLESTASSQASLNAVYPDGTVHLVWALLITGVGLNSAMMPYPIFIPAGIGLTCSSSTPGLGNVSITYNLYTN